MTKSLRINADRIGPETTIFGDLGIDSDVGDQFLDDFAREFSVDMTGYRSHRYFGWKLAFPWAPIHRVLLALRNGSPEERARLRPIRVKDLVRSAELRRWAGG